MVLVDNYNEFFNMISDKGLNIVENIIKNGHNLQVCFVFTANPNNLSPHVGTPLYSQVFKGMQGILFGGKMDGQNVFDVQMDYKKKRAAALDSGWVIS